MSLSIKVNGTALPGEVVSISQSNELLWSEGTGRAASTGLMTGSVVAKKQTFSIKWGVITHAQYMWIRQAIGSGFMSLVIVADGVTLADLMVYRSNIAGEMLSLAGDIYWKDVAVDLIER